MVPLGILPSTIHYLALGETMSYVQYSMPYPVAAFGDPFNSTAGRPNAHRGRDIAPEGGGPAIAIADGVLVSDWFSRTLGNVAVLKHDDGKFSGYRHLAAESPRVIGTTVKRGEGFATIGATGTLAQGRHLCLTVATSMAGAIGGYDVIDPDVWIASHSVPAQASAAATATTAGWIYWAPDGTGRVARVQAALAELDRYDGNIDDYDGPKTRKGIQFTLAHSGEFVGLIDGVIEGGGCLGMQTYGKRFGDYIGRLDAQPRELTWDAFALGLERP